MEQSYYWQGLEQIKAGDLPGAIASLSCAIRQEPENPTIYYQRGQVLSQLQDLQGAIADYSQALELNPQHFEAYTARAIAYLATQNPTAALTDAEKAAVFAPASAPAQQLLGLVYKQNQRTQLAVEAYQRAANLFLAQQDEGNCRRCIESYKQLQAQLPPTPEDFLAQVKQKIYRGESAAAMADLNWLLQADPQNAQALSLRGVIHSQKGNSVMALEDLSRAMNLAPEDWEIRMHRGIVRRFMGDALGAIADFDQLLREHPSRVEVYANRGFARCQLKEYRQGIEDFSRAIALKPDQPQYYCDRSEARYEFGDITGAIQDLQEAANIWFNQGATQSYQRGIDRIKTWQQELETKKLDRLQQQSLSPTFAGFADFSVPSLELQQRLLGMVGGNSLIAQRLIAIAKEDYPQMPEEWYWQKVIFDLESQQDNLD
jgi:tetratricopeptide (TPR) repeat protein